MPSGIESQGITLGYSYDASPSTFVTIGNVTDFSGPGGSATVIDISNLSSTYKEKLMGLPDAGQLTFNINYDPDNATHKNLILAQSNRHRGDWKVTFTDATPTTCVFYGYVLGFSLSGGVDAAVKAAVTVEIDGPMAWV